ncbi:hypothetical protein ACSFA0_22900 [Variovorax sp. LT1P1]|uniref:hypothetical protein n=1 Tax=Variovorax sp. LT1P1 TaxID=3443730 RepID=UPI003F46CB56
MNDDDAEFAAGAFTDLERAAGVPKLLGMGGRQPPPVGRATDQDCVALIVRSWVADRLGPFDLRVHRTGDREDIDRDLGHLSALNTQSARTTAMSLHAHGFGVEVSTMMNALRSTGVPLWMDGGERAQWLAWNGDSECLVSNVIHQGFGNTRSFYPNGLASPLQDPQQPERARVFNLLRAAYLTSDHGKKPLLVHADHLAQALAGKAVPYLEPRTIVRTESPAFSLVYFNAAGKPTAIPLPEALDEGVTISTRDTHWFLLGRGRGSLRPALTKDVAWANGFEMAVSTLPSDFRYYTRRSRGTVFQSAFEPVDVPSDMMIRDMNPTKVAEQAAAMSAFAHERGTEMYMTAGQHPLSSLYYQEVTTPAAYASALGKLRDFGIAAHGSAGISPFLYWEQAGHNVEDRFGPYGLRWSPSGTA